MEQLNNNYLKVFLINGISRNSLNEPLNDTSNLFIYRKTFQPEQRKEATKIKSANKS